MKIVGVKINDTGSILYYDSGDFNLKKNLTVIVKNDKGLQFAKVIHLLEVDESEKYDKIIRIASKSDYQKHLTNLKEADNALKKCRELALKEGLNMMIIDAVFNFDRTQLSFRFLSDERVDFRNLARELGSKFRTRVELRQIGIRDKAKEIGGFGPCGRLLCCTSFLNSFESVSINMAKNQGIALNPNKINGVCGRLLCCLNYENEAYTIARKDVPEVGKKVYLEGKEGKVVSSSPLVGQYKALIDNEVVDVGVHDSKK